MGGGAARRKLIIAAFTLVTLSIYVTMQTVQQFMPARSARVYGTEEYIKNLERTVAEFKRKCYDDKSQDGSTVAQCRPIKKLAFAKTHKTGSSTLQNIFFRFGAKHELNFAMPVRDTWMFPFKLPFQSYMVNQGSWKDVAMDMFVFHSVWNYVEVKRLIPEAKFVTILRDPVDSFESNYVYMGLERVFKMDINEFAQKQAAEGVPRRPRAIIGKNQLLWDLGLPTSHMENQTLVKQKVARLDTEFDLVMMVDRFDESLILLRDLMCWTTDDIAYLKQNERVASSKSNMTDETRHILKQWLWADYLLYDHFAAKFENELKFYGQDKMAAETKKLNSVNKRIKELCVKEQADNNKLKGEFKMALNIVLGYVIDEDKPWCALYARSEPNFVKQLRYIQELRVRTKRLNGIMM